MIWRIIRHRANLLHGPAAAVLQVAHPRIGLGVYDHSDFQSDPTARLHRTLDTVYTMVFDTVDRADVAAGAIEKLHDRVRGDAASRAVSGPAYYSAFEMDLLMWVLATLVVAALDGYERAADKLTGDEKERFYQDMRKLGTFFRLPCTYGPQTYSHFVLYWNQHIHDPLLASHPICREIAQAVARPRRPWFLYVATLPIQFIYSEILPLHLREPLGFRSTVFSRAMLCATTVLLRILNRFAPDSIRYVPHYRHALKRMGAEQAGATRLSATG
jgi:uncharacterized protein (DUF2236 family)